MALILYSHPFSSYCQKVLSALWENNTPLSIAILKILALCKSWRRCGH